LTPFFITVVGFTNVPNLRVGGKKIDYVCFSTL